MSRWPKKADPELQQCRDRAIGSVADMITNGTQILKQLKDIEELANQVLSEIKNPARKQNLQRFVSKDELDKASSASMATESLYDLPRTKLREAIFDEAKERMSKLDKTRQILEQIAKTKPKMIAMQPIVL